MVCQQLSELYELSQKNQLRLGGSDLIRILCKQCNQEETCPSMLSVEYDSAYHDKKPSENLAFHKMKEAFRGGDV